MDSIIDGIANNPNSGLLHDFSSLNIAVFGIGDAGCSIVDKISLLKLSAIRLIACNTDSKSLNSVSDSISKVLIGKELSNGFGTNGFPEIGAKAAELNRGSIEHVLHETNLLFVVAGMGGGTGTGSAPIVAEIAKEQGALVIAIVTYPFALEKARLVKAENGIARLIEFVDSAIVIDNNKMIELIPNLPIQQAFNISEEVIVRIIHGIVETISQPSLINLDFQEFKSIMAGKGLCVVGVGESKSMNRAEDTVEDLFNNILLDVDVSIAENALIQLTGGMDFSMAEANKIIELLRKQMNSSAKIIWSARLDKNFSKKTEAIAVFTGLKQQLIESKETVATKQTGLKQEF